MGKKDRTRQWIAARYLELAEEMSLSKITVQAICTQADISRSTFYYHFSSIQDIIHWIYHAEVNGPIQRNLKADPFYQADVSTDALKSLYKRKDFWIRVLRLPTAEEFIAFYLQDTKENWRCVMDAILIRNNIKKDELSEEQQLELDYISDYFYTAHAHISLRWIKEGMKQNPEYLAALIDSISGHGFWYALKNALGLGEQVSITDIPSDYSS